MTTAAQQGIVATAMQGSWGAFAVDDPKTSRTVGKWEFAQVPSAKTGEPSHPRGVNDQRLKIFEAWGRGAEFGGLA